MVQIRIKDFSVDWESDQEVHHVLFLSDPRDELNKCVQFEPVKKPGLTGTLVLLELINYLLNRFVQEYPSDTWHKGQVTFEIGFLPCLMEIHFAGASNEQVLPRDPRPADKNKVEQWWTITVEPGQGGYPAIGSLSIKPSENKTVTPVELEQVPNKSDTAASTTPAVVTNDQTTTGPADAVVEPKKETEETIMNAENPQDKPAAEKPVVPPPAPPIELGYGRAGDTINLWNLPADVVNVTIRIVRTIEQQSSPVSLPWETRETDIQPEGGKLEIHDFAHKAMINVELEADKEYQIKITVETSCNKLTDLIIKVTGAELLELRGAQALTGQAAPAPAPAPATDSNAAAEHEVIPAAPTVPAPVATPPVDTPPVLPQPTPQPPTPPTPPPVNTAEKLIMDEQEARIVKITADLVRIESGTTPDEDQDAMLEDMLYAVRNKVQKALKGLAGVQVDQINDDCKDIVGRVEAIQALRSPVWSLINQCTQEIAFVLKAITAAQDGRNDVELETLFSAFENDVAKRHSPTPTAVTQLHEKAERCLVACKKKLADIKAAAKAEASKKQAEQLEKLAADNAAKEQELQALREQVAKDAADKAELEAAAKRDREASDKLRKDVEDKEEALKQAEKKAAGLVIELQEVKKEIVKETPPSPNIPPAPQVVHNYYGTPSNQPSKADNQKTEAEQPPKTPTKGPWWMIPALIVVGAVVLLSLANCYFAIDDYWTKHVNKDTTRQPGAILNPRQYPSDGTLASTNGVSALPLANITGIGNSNNIGGNVYQNIGGNQYIYPPATNTVMLPSTSTPTPPPAPKAKEDEGGKKPQCQKHACSSGSKKCWVCDDEPNRILAINAEKGSQPGNTKDWSTTIGPEDKLQVDIEPGSVVSFGMTTASLFEVYVRVNGEYVPWTPSIERDTMSDTYIDRLQVRLKPGNGPETLYLRAICKT